MSVTWVSHTVKKGKDEWFKSQVGNWVTILLYILVQMYQVFFFFFLINSPFTFWRAPWEWLTEYKGEIFVGDKKRKDDSFVLSASWDLN